MGILEAAKPVIIICTRDRTRAAEFYQHILGLEKRFEDNLATVFDVGGIALRLSTVPDFTPHEHTVLGFKVANVSATVRALRGKGVTFNIYKGFPQDELGILVVPKTEVQVAWFNDGDGNVLSVTNV